MGGLFPNPLSNDGVDRLNHKWMLLLMLLLSLAAFIIPLHPSYHNSSQQTMSESESNLPDTIPKTRVKGQAPQVECWCPAHFVNSAVRYTNTFCKARFVSVLKGNNDTNLIYGLPEHEIIPSMDSGNPNNYKDSLTETIKQYNDAVWQVREIEAERRKLETRVQALVTYQTPLMLLGMAAILAVPQVLWSVLSDFCSPFNLAQTLASTRQTNAADQKQIFEDLLASLASCFQTCPKTASVLYLVKKVLSILVAIALLLVVTQYAVPKIQDMEEQSDSLRPLTNVKVSSHYDAIKISPTLLSPQDAFKPPNNVFLCDLSIRHLDNIQRFTIQCAVTFSEVSQNEAGSHPLPQAPQPATSSNRNKNLLALEATLFQMVTAVLAILAVANVFSLCGWLYSLTSASSKNSVRLSGNAAMDQALLVHMARINRGADTAHRLAHCSSVFNKVSLDEMT